jgi:two-component system sensor histidine kinase KdpD
MIGKPLRKGLFGFLKRTPVDKLIRSRKEADIYLIEPLIDERTVRSKRPPVPKARFNIKQYGLSLLLLLPIIAAGFLLNRALKIENFSVIFIISVIASAFLYGKGPSLFISVLSVLCYDYFFVPPFHTFRVANPEYFIELAIFIGTAYIVAEITRLFRQQKEAMRMRLENIRVLEQMGRELLNVPTIEQILETTAEHKISQEFAETIQMINVDILKEITGIISNYLTTVFKIPHMVIFMDLDAKLKIWARSDAGLAFTENDYAIAHWVYNNGEPAGKGTQTLVASEYVFLPMRTEAGTVGVIGLKADYSLLMPQEKYFISAITSLSAIAAERCTHIINKSR